MTEPIVSVIVPCYNAEKFLPTLFKCFNKQTYKNFQVIFVDDGSTDGTLAVLNGYCAIRPQHTVITGENAGAASARRRTSRLPRSSPRRSARRWPARVPSWRRSGS
ncbi:MAG: glycosyltransferase, partial [Clostridia bacterium]|nr:glycosyltransferase [Clostridia bacterium]